MEDAILAIASLPSCGWLVGDDIKHTNFLNKKNEPIFFICHWVSKYFVMTTEKYLIQGSVAHYFPCFLFTFDVFMGMNSSYV